MEIVATNAGGFLTTTVTTECACTECVNPECDETYTRTDDTCQTCNTDTEGTEYCFGGCWDEMNDELSYLLSQWAHYAEDIFVVRGTSVGWMNRNVSEVLEYGCNNEAFISAIAPSGDYTQRWSLDGDSLTVFQTHHDSPTGETFVFEPLTLESFVDSGLDKVYGDDLIDMRVGEIIGEAAMSRHCHSDAGTFDPRDVFDVMQHMGEESDDDVFDAARRVARAEWDDDRLRVVRYADMLADIRF